MSERLIEALKDMERARGNIRYYNAACSAYAASSAYPSASYAAYYAASYAASYSETKKVKEITLELLCQRD